MLTLTRIVCRLAPGSVLLVRPVLRAVAAERSVRSASLFVPATGTTSPWGIFTGTAVTNVNSSWASIIPINKQCLLTHLSGGVRNARALTQVTLLELILDFFGVRMIRKLNVDGAGMVNGRCSEDLVS